MSSSIWIQIISIIYVILLIIIYLSKEKIKSVENSLFIALVLTNLIGLFIDLSCIYTMTNIDVIPKVNIFMTRIYLIYYHTWIYLFMLYIIFVSAKNSKIYVENRKKIKSLFKKTLPIFIIINILLIILPLQYKITNMGMNSYGKSVEFLYVVIMIYLTISIICIIRNYKEIKNKKYIPLFAFFVIGGISMIIQKIYPSLILIPATEAFIGYLMYFTIENPDMKLIAQLNEAKAQAEKANNAKSEFLSSMSHEIRTPLNAIVGFSQALEEEDITGTAKDEISDIKIASENLLEIVNGILDISKIEANKLEIINNEYEFSKIINELITLTKVRIGDRDLEFRATIDESIPKYLYGDHTRIKQIILNLLTNAVKYTKEGYVELKVNSVKKDNVCRLIVSVEDSGIGIKQDKIDKLFSKFERLGVENEITIEGTGLGLAITKKLVELMNGKIVVQSVYGKGSRFTIAIDQKTVTKLTNTPEEKQEVLNIFDASNKKILIVDDNKINLKVATRLLQNYKPNIDQVMSGAECLEKVKENNYDLILMDDMMPRMSGTETFKRLKTDENFKTPVVILTANAISGMKEKYLKEGFNDYLSKPIEKEELNRVLNKFLNK